MHPVVNDATLSMWQEIGVICWPTMIMLGMHKYLVKFLNKDFSLTQNIRINGNFRSKRTTISNYAR